MATPSVSCSTLKNLKSQTKYNCAAIKFQSLPVQEILSNIAKVLQENNILLGAVGPLAECSSRVKHIDKILQSFGLVKSVKNRDNIQSLIELNSTQILHLMKKLQNVQDSFEKQGGQPLRCENQLNSLFCATATSAATSSCGKSLKEIYNNNSQLASTWKDEDSIRTDKDNDFLGFHTNNNSSCFDTIKNISESKQFELNYSNFDDSDNAGSKHCNTNSESRSHDNTSTQFNTDVLSKNTNSATSGIKINSSSLYKTTESSFVTQVKNDTDNQPLLCLETVDVSSPVKVANDNIHNPEMETMDQEESIGIRNSTEVKLLNETTTQVGNNELVPDSKRWDGSHTKMKYECMPGQEKISNIANFLLKNNLSHQDIRPGVCPVPHKKTKLMIKLLQYFNLEVTQKNRKLVNAFIRVNMGKIKQSISSFRNKQNPKQIVNFSIDTVNTQHFLQNCTITKTNFLQLDTTELSSSCASTPNLDLSSQSKAKYYEFDKQNVESKYSNLSSQDISIDKSTHHHNELSDPVKDGFIVKKLPIHGLSKNGKNRSYYHATQNFKKLSLQEKTRRIACYLRENNLTAEYIVQSGPQKNHNHLDIMLKDFLVWPCKRSRRSIFDIIRRYGNKIRMHILSLNKLTDSSFVNIIKTDSEQPTSAHTETVDLLLPTKISNDIHNLKSQNIYQKSHAMSTCSDNKVKVVDEALKTENKNEKSSKALDCPEKISEISNDVDEALKTENKNENSSKALGCPEKISEISNDRSVTVAFRGGRNGTYRQFKSLTRKEKISKIVNYLLENNVSPEDVSPALPLKKKSKHFDKILQLFDLVLLPKYRLSISCLIKRNFVYIKNVIDSSYNELIGTAVVGLSDNNVNTIRQVINTNHDTQNNLIIQETPQKIEATAGFSSSCCAGVINKDLSSQSESKCGKKKCNAEKNDELGMCSENKVKVVDEALKTENKNEKISKALGCPEKISEISNDVDEALKTENKNENSSKALGCPEKISEISNDRSVTVAFRGGRNGTYRQFKSLTRKEKISKIVNCLLENNVSPEDVNPALPLKKKTKHFDKILQMFDLVLLPKYRFSISALIKRNFVYIKNVIDSSHNKLVGTPVVALSDNNVNTIHQMINPNHDTQNNLIRKETPQKIEATADFSSSCCAGVINKDLSSQSEPKYGKKKCIAEKNDELGMCSENKVKVVDEALKTENKNEKISKALGCPEKISEISNDRLVTVAFRGGRNGTYRQFKSLTRKEKISKIVNYLLENNVSPEDVSPALPLKKKSKHFDKILQLFDLVLLPKYRFSISALIKRNFVYIKNVIDSSYNKLVGTPVVALSDNNVNTIRQVINTNHDTQNNLIRKETPQKIEATADFSSSCCAGVINKDLSSQSEPKYGQKKCIAEKNDELGMCSENKVKVVDEALKTENKNEKCSKALGCPEKISEISNDRLVTVAFRGGRNGTYRQFKSLTRKEKISKIVNCLLENNVSPEDVNPALPLKKKTKHFDKILQMFDLVLLPKYRFSISALIKRNFVYIKNVIDSSHNKLVGTPVVALSDNNVNTIHQMINPNHDTQNSPISNENVQQLGAAAQFFSSFCAETIEPSLLSINDIDNSKMESRHMDQKDNDIDICVDNAVEIGEALITINKEERSSIIVGCPVTTSDIGANNVLRVTKRVGHGGKLRKYRSMSLKEKVSCIVNYLLENNLTHEDISPALPIKERTKHFHEIMQRFGLVIIERHLTAVRSFIKNHFLKIKTLMVSHYNKEKGISVEVVSDNVNTRQQITNTGDALSNFDLDSCADIQTDSSSNNLELTSALGNFAIKGSNECIFKSISTKEMVSHIANLLLINNKSYKEISPEIPNTIKAKHFNEILETLGLETSSTNKYKLSLFIKSHINNIKYLIESHYNALNKISIPDEVGHVNAVSEWPATIEGLSVRDNLSSEKTPDLSSMTLVDIDTHDEISPNTYDSSSHTVHNKPTPKDTEYFKENEQTNFDNLRRTVAQNNKVLKKQKKATGTKSSLLDFLNFDSEWKKY